MRYYLSFHIIWLHLSISGLLIRTIGRRLAILDSWKRRKWDNGFEDLNLEAVKCGPFG